MARIGLQILRMCLKWVLVSFLRNSYAVPINSMAVHLSVIFVLQSLLLIGSLVAIITSFFLVTEASIGITVTQASTNALDKLRSDFSLTLAAAEPPALKYATLIPVYQDEGYRVSTGSRSITTVDRHMSALVADLNLNPGWEYMYQSYELPSGKWTDLSVARGFITYGDVNNFDHGFMPTIPMNWTEVGDATFRDPTDNKYIQEIRGLQPTQRSSGYWQRSSLYYEPLEDVWKPLMTFSVPIEFSATGACRLAVSADVSLLFIAELLRSLATNGNFIYLVDVTYDELLATSLLNTTVAPYNATVADATPTLWPMGATPNAAINAAWALINAASPNGSTKDGRNSVFSRLGDELISATHVRGDQQSLHWLVTDHTPREVYFGASRRLTNILIAVAVVVVVVCVAFCIASYVAVVKPLNKLSESMASVARLDEGGSNDAPALGELQGMHASFVHMKTAIGSFTRYVPRDVVRSLMARGELCSLMMAPLRCAILFTDIESFTTICEQVPADILSPVIQEYFDRMSAIVMRHDGLIDKFIGDCIMAVWGAPFPIDAMDMRATLCALQLQKETTLDPLAGAFRRVGQRLGVRVGVNRGEVLAGNMGSSERMNYTVIGDAVNLAARLEGLNKQFGTRVMISEFVAQRIDGVVLRLLGVIAVVGKTQPVRVFEALGMTEEAAVSALEDSVVPFNAGEEPDVVVFGVNKQKMTFDPSTADEGLHSPAQNNLEPTATSARSGSSTYRASACVMDGTVRHDAQELLRDGRRRLVAKQDEIRFARKYTTAVNHYLAARFREAVDTLEFIESAFDGEYRNAASLRDLKRQCELYLRQAPPPGFTGVMTAKEK